MNTSSAYDQNLPSYSEKEFQYLKAAIEIKKAQSRGRINTHMAVTSYLSQHQMLQLRDKKVGRN